MRSSILRGLAGSVGRLLPFVYPGRRSDWARAMRLEIAQVEDDGAALVFALGCLWGGLRAAAEGKLWSSEGDEMEFGKPKEPRAVAIACALAATCLGLAYLAAAGAPMRYLVVNAIAFLLGIVALHGVGGAMAQAGRHSGPLLVLLGAGLLATALAGTAVDGAARWIWIGPLGVQVSLVLLPFMIVTFARYPGLLGCVGIAIAAAALALQPDRAMAGVLAFAMAVLAVSRPGRWPAGALIAAVAAFAATLARPDALQAVPFVDRILFTAFDLHWLAGAAVLLGALLLLVPAIAGRRGDPALGHAWLALGAVWLGCILSAALGNYPTPVVGYGGSAILGYLLSFASLPAHAASARGEAEPGTDEVEGELGGLRSASLA